MRGKFEFDELYKLIGDKIKKVFAEAREAMNDGLRVSEVWKLIESTVESLVAIVEELPATGAEKKEAVLDLIDQFYVEEIKPINLKFVPDVIEGFVDKTIGDAVRPTADWLIDKVVATLAENKPPSFGPVA